MDFFRLPFDVLNIILSFLNTNEHLALELTSKSHKDALSHYWRWKFNSQFEHNRAIPVQPIFANLLKKNKFKILYFRALRYVNFGVLYPPIPASEIAQCEEIPLKSPTEKLYENLSKIGGKKLMTLIIFLITAFTIMLALNIHAGIIDFIFVFLPIELIFLLTSFVQIVKTRADWNKGMREEENVEKIKVSLWKNSTISISLMDLLLQTILISLRFHFTKKWKWTVTFIPMWVLMAWLFTVAFCLSTFSEMKRVASILVPVPSYILLCLIFICGKLDGWVKSTWQVVLAPIWTVELLCVVGLLRVGMRELRLAAIFTTRRKIQTYLKLTAWISPLIFTVLTMYKAETGLSIPWLGIFSFVWFGLLQALIWTFVC